MYFSHPLLYFMKEHWGSERIHYLHLSLHLPSYQLTSQILSPNALHVITWEIMEVLMYICLRVLLLILHFHQSHQS